MERGEKIFADIAPASDIIGGRTPELTD